jgi:hypothetical protein
VRLLGLYTLALRGHRISGATAGIGILRQSNPTTEVRANDWTPTRAKD